MNIKRFRDPLVAALGALLIAGVSVAMANSPSAAASAPAASAEDPAGAADTDTIEDGAPDTEGAEADEAGPDEQDPNYAGKATILVDESTLPEDEAAEGAALAALATVSQADAESAALGAVNGEVVTAELGNENGYVVWSVEVRDAAGMSTEVAIDAGSGDVLGTQAGGDVGEE
ncbi:MAG: hypothetical protein QOI85_1568 [Chloroflexota bacterium]|jgi:uncharacterized membrane protein YkoI|nr:hypothetical protein [Chloroflexota bacterium]